jgi:hypothetical protein
LVPPFRHCLAGRRKKQIEPGERHNLAGEPAHRHTEEALRRALEERWIPVERGG